MSKETVIDGFRFSDPADGALAQDEVKRIKYIASKMNMQNPQGVLAVYDKLIASGIFVTPVGYEYLRTLQNYLFKSPDINDADVKEIPVAISYSNALDKRSKEREEKIKTEKSRRTLVKTFRNEYLISLGLNVVLIIAVIAMFVITLKAENPNMINYRTAIINQYSDWQQELEQREEALRQRELKLQKQGVTIEVPDGDE